MKPRSRISSTPPRETDPSVYECCGLFRPKWSTEHLFSARGSCHTLVQARRVSSAAWIASESAVLWIGRKTFRSSAYICAKTPWDSIRVGISDVKMMKSRGPSTEPCGTPLVTGRGAESTHTHFEHSSSKVVLQPRNNSGGNPKAISLWMSFQCSTRSNAFAKSKYTVSTEIPVSIKLDHFSRLSSRRFLAIFQHGSRIAGLE